MMKQSTTTKLENYKRAFESSATDRTCLEFLNKYLLNGSHIYVDKKTGLVSSDRILSAHEILNYWSEKIFTSTNKEDYSAFRPFARARLQYVSNTFFDYMKNAGVNVSDGDTYCDFASGQGVLPKIVKEEKPNLEIFATEGSLPLCADLQRLYGKDNVFNCGLGESLLPDFQVKFGSLTWTLCNCIEPLKVMQEVSKKITVGGYLVVADSSRVLTPYKKSLVDFFPKKDPMDIHPFIFSKNSLSALLNIVGFDIVYVNRYFDTDSLVVIAKRIEDETIKMEKIVDCDDVEMISDFFLRWDRETTYFEGIR